MKPIFIKEFSAEKDEEEVLFAPLSNFKIKSEPREGIFKKEK